jgi:Ca2+/Na+ antiporter
MASLRSLFGSTARQLCRRLQIAKPPCIGLLMLLAFKQWEGFTMTVGALRCSRCPACKPAELSSVRVPGSVGFPVAAIVVLCSLALSVFILATSNAEQRPSYYEGVASVLAFASSIAWMNLVARECVAVLQSVGVIWDVSSGIRTLLVIGLLTNSLPLTSLLPHAALLGLTVLAIGNSIGDFVSNTAVARYAFSDCSACGAPLELAAAWHCSSGYPATALASCFGSPLLNDVVGLGIALTITTASTTLPLCCTALR